MKYINFCIGVVSGLFLVLAPNLYADTYSIEQHIRAFKADPKAFMKDQKSIQKYRQNYRVTAFDGVTHQPIAWELESETVDNEKSKFPDELIKNRDFVILKNQFHEGIGEEVEPGRAGILKNDRAEALLGVDKLKLTRLQDMDGLKSAKVAQSPWSGDYWPNYAGGIARPYANSNYKPSSNWLVNEQYITSNSCSVNDLSPAEKYDLLVGDEHKSLTNAILNEIRDMYQNSNANPSQRAIPTWTGICHGWAPAAFLEERPSHTINVLAFDGKTKITFYPSDIKALTSLLWAKAPTKSNFVGSRCKIKNPPEDPSNGRILAQECFDTNPGTWHLAVVNSIGLKKRSFILDATYDAEVWNQPAYSYEYKYFNPQTGKEVLNLEDAKVKLADFTDDKFKEYRIKRNSNEAMPAVIVGIAMKLIYIAETRPNHQEKDNDSLDRRVAVNYLYDLELDEKGNIIGGEWYHQQHPDFLWAPSENSLAQSAEDQDLSQNYKHTTWRNRERRSIPSIWQQRALESSSRSQPLRHIIERLIQKANQTTFLGIHFNFNPTRE